MVIFTQEHHKRIAVRIRELESLTNGGRAHGFLPKDAVVAMMAELFEEADNTVEEGNRCFNRIKFYEECYK